MINHTMQKTRSIQSEMKSSLSRANARNSEKGRREVSVQIPTTSAHESQSVVSLIRYCFRVSIGRLRPGLALCPIRTDSSVIEKTVIRRHNQHLQRFIQTAVRRSVAGIDGRTIGGLRRRPR